MKRESDNNRSKKALNKNHFYLLLMIFPIAIFSKAFQYLMLGEKYFIDSNKILNLILGNTNLYGASYHFAAQFFKSINIFHLNSLFSWSVYLAIILNLCFFILLCKVSSLRPFDYVYIYVSIFLLNVFSFNLNKEVLQLLFFYFIYIIFRNRKYSNTKKLVFSILILILEAVTFRTYYILLVVTFGLAFLILNYTLKSKNQSNMMKLIFFSSILFLGILNISKYIMPDMYNDLLNVRNGYETGLADANTLIKSVFKNNSNFLYYSLNYVINTIRIFFPFELLLKGVKYIPFIIYQLLNIYIISYGTKKINKNNIMYVSFLIGYFLLSGTYEPDFGSVIRHESVLLMFFILASTNSHTFKKGEI